MVSVRMIHTLILMAFLLTIIFLILPTVSAKAGGVPQGNYTALTLDSSQTTPNCGLNCHDNGILNQTLEVNTTANYSSTMELLETQTIEITVRTNDTADELSVMLMNATEADGTGPWAQPEGILIIASNESGHNDNYQENTTTMDFIWTILANESGWKNLTLHVRGGLAAGGSQDWLQDNNLIINVTEPPAVTQSIHIHYTHDPPSACANCEVEVFWSNESLVQAVNYSIDGAASSIGCLACTDLHLDFNSIADGTHNITIITSILGNETDDFIKRNTTYYDYPYALEDNTQDGDGMILQMYLLLFMVGIALMLISMIQKDSVGIMTPLLSGLFLFMTAFYSFDIEQQVAGVTYSYIYEPIGVFCGLLGLLMFGMTLWKSTIELPSEPRT